MRQIILGQNANPVPRMGFRTGLISISFGDRIYQKWTTASLERVDRLFCLLGFSHIEGDIRGEYQVCSNPVAERRRNPVAEQRRLPGFLGTSE